MSLVCAEENDTALTSDSINIEANDVSMFYKNGTRLSTVLTDTNDTPVSNASLIITINGLDYKRTTNDEGKASLAINLIPGSYIANINFLGNDKYSPLNKTVNVNVLSTIAGNDLVKYYKNSSQYQATFFDGTGNVLTNTAITFNINGVFYTRHTNNKGVAQLNINLNPGDYILTAYNTNDGCSFSNKIKVLSTINSSDLVKIFKDNRQFVVTARNFNGELLSYQDVEFNVHGVFYTRQSNKYGISKLNINLEPGNYIITAYNKITGEAIGNYITVYANSDTKLTTKNYVFKSNDDDTIQATLTNKLNYGVAGETINLAIGNKKYSTITDDNGVANFYLNLSEGNYSLSFSHDANSRYGASSAKSTVETYDGIKARLVCYSDIMFSGGDYKAELYDENDEPFANQTVYMNINSQILSAVTDEKGIAIFKMNLPDEVFHAKVFYNGTGYKFTYSLVEIIIFESTLTTLRPLTQSVIEGIGDKIFACLAVSSIKLFNQKVIIEINGINYTRTTDEYGLVNLTINLSPGTYNVNYYYLGDDFFDSAFNSSKLTVNPRISTALTVLTSSTFHKNSGITFNIELKAEDVLEGKTVNVKIGSKSFTQMTDANGVIHLDIDDFAEGSYDVVYSFAGDTDYAPSMGSIRLAITSQIPYGYGYWVRYSDMYNLDLASLASQGTKHVFLHSYAITAYGEGAVSSWAKQANNYGIKVHIWMQVAYDGSWHGIANKDGSYNYDLINSRINQAKYYAGISGISGVHFDYLRFGGTAYKYPNAAESINYFVRTAVSAVKSVNPNCLVSAALMPEPDSMIYYYGQDYSTLTKYLDFVLPMVYKGNYNQNTAWIQSISKWFVDNSNGAQVWTGLQAYRSDNDITRLPVSELSGDAQAALNGGARGVVMFRWGVTNFINFNNLKIT
ncbi:MAG: hypothetical protein E7Z73_08595 [Methanobrevibacter millerae]|uniref:Adhesin-like protein n=1 Tax=Methanobrevibacter millerae TaxID=230361 RepID=A0A8T3VI25_9EURY|nr:hypothetical protein [Methanobrevibacter millerae]MBE6505776.1 hypothetical protein [Methanobrevibacter millerae]